MTTPSLPPPPPLEDTEPGPCMLALTSRQRKFVENLLAGMSQTDAYINAGYTYSNRAVAGQSASHLAHAPGVQKAILEQGHAFAGARIIQWMSQLEAIAQNESQPGLVRLKAIHMLLTRGGSIEKSEVKITHERDMSEKEWRQRVLTSARLLGIDPQPLLAKYNFIDADFDVVSDQPVRIEQAPEVGVDASGDFLNYGPDTAE